MSPRRSVTVLAAADALRSPWKNGRGVTEQLALWPDGADFARGDFEARISAADVRESGPFSDFAGLERVLVVTAGAGLVLSHGEHAPRARLRPLEPYRFWGDWSTQAELVGGAIRDFNVFTRRASLRADVEAVRLGSRRLREPLDALHALVHIVSGAATARVTGEEEPFTLATRDSLRIDDARSVDELELLGGAADTVVIVVRLRSVSA